MKILNLKSGPVSPLSSFTEPKRRGPELVISHLNQGHNRKLATATKLDPLNRLIKKLNKKLVIS